MDILEYIVERFIETFNPEITETELDDFMIAVSREKGGDRHWMASAQARIVAKKHQHVRRLIRQGIGNTAIAERVGLTRQQVWNIRQEMTAPPSSPLP